MTQHTNETDAREPGTSLAASIFAGAGIGLMVGLLLGLAAPSLPPAKPVVAIFIGAVGAGLAALLGVNDRHFSTAKALRIGSFGIAVVIAAPAGIYSRDHGLFSPTLKQRAEDIQEITKASGKEALELLAKLDAAKKRTGDTSKNASAIQNLTMGSYLYANKVNRGICEKLKKTKEDTHSSAKVIKNFRFHDRKAKSGWTTLANAVEKQLDGDDQKGVLFIARDAACGLGNFKKRLAPNETQCKKIEGSKTKTFPELKASFDAAELGAVFERVGQEISPKGQTVALRLLGEVICSDKEGEQS